MRLVHKAISGLLAATIATPAMAEQIVLKSGDRMSGTILSRSAETVRFQSVYGAVIDIPASDLAADDSSANDRIVGQQTASVQAGPAQTAQAVKEADKPGVFGAKWKGRANAGGAQLSGNTEEKSISADLASEARWDHDRANIALTYNWQKTEEEVTKDNQTAEGNYDHFLIDNDWFDEKTYVNYNASYKSDDIADLDLRTAAGVGLGRQVYERDDLNLKFAGGPVWLHQEYQDGTVDNSLAGLWAFDYEQKLFDDLIEAFHHHRILSPADDWSAYQLDSSTGLRVPLKKGFVATAELQYDRNNAPSEDAEKDDTAYMLKLGYQWE